MSDLKRDKKMRLGALEGSEISVILRLLITAVVLTSGYNHLVAGLLGPFVCASAASTASGPSSSPRRCCVSSGPPSARPGSATATCSRRASCRASLPAPIQSWSWRASAFCILCTRGGRRLGASSSF